MEQEQRKKKFVIGDRVYVESGGWVGRIAAIIGSKAFITANRLGEDYYYLVLFTEPAYDVEGQGPFKGANIDSEYLQPIPVEKLLTMETNVALTGIRWNVYQEILEDRDERSTPRFTYNTGAIKVVYTTLQNEKMNRLVARLVEQVLETWGVNYDNLGSMTLRMRTVEKGLDPDTCFYIAHVGALNDQDTAELEKGDPPPDLVIETNQWVSVEKLPIYAAFGVPEVWRIRRNHAEILVLQNGTYVVAPESAALPKFSAEVLRELLQRSEMMTRGVWASEVTAWATANNSKEGEE